MTCLVTALWWKMGDQRPAAAMPGTPAALGIPLQHWILPVWRELLKTSHQCWALWTPGQTGPSSLPSQLPGSPEQSGCLYNVPAFLSPSSWTSCELGWFHSTKHSYLPVLSDSPWHRGKGNWFPCWSSCSQLLYESNFNLCITLLFCLPSLTDR